MKQVRITNEQYLKIINESVNSSIYLLEGDRYVDDEYTNKFKDSITNKIKDKLKTDKTLSQHANELGINPNYSKNEKMGLINKMFDKDGTISSDINDEVKKVVEILKSGTNKNGSIDFAKIRRNADSGNYGLSYAKILKIKDFIDSNNLRWVYDSTAPRLKTTKFGIDSGSTDISNFDINNINQKHFNDWYSSRKDTVPQALAPLQMKLQLLEKYLQSEYGIDFIAPSFSLGNEKVVDALMVNFTSAYRCPAWNECLVKHACYARSNETMYYHNEKTSNDKKNLMWLACENDPELLKLVYNLLKAYVVNWKKVGELLSLDKSLGKLIKGNSKVNTLSEMYFKDIPSEIIEVIKKCKRVSYIRLNENGDFINQNLLMQFDKLAEDFKIIDVRTAAYSCRTLKFDKIKNIIINASRTNMNGPTIERYFYAVPKKMYDAFEDTYTSMSMTDSFDSIEKNPLPLFSVDANGNKTPNGSYYYKCPCSRNDFTLIGKNGKKKSKVNCFQCHLCYEENDKELKEKLKNGGKLFVFVKAHGSNANMLDDKREQEIITKVGVPQNYEIGLRDDGLKYKDEDEITESKSFINESSSSNEAYNEITKNAIYSMTQHFGNINGNTVSENKENFFTNSVRKVLNTKG